MNRRQEAHLTFIFLLVDDLSAIKLFQNISLFFPVANSDLDLMAPCTCGQSSAEIKSTEKQIKKWQLFSLNGFFQVKARKGNTATLLDMCLDSKQRLKARNPVRLF